MDWSSRPLANVALAAQSSGIHTRKPAVTKRPQKKARKSPGKQGLTAPPKRTSSSPTPSPVKAKGGLSKLLSPQSLQDTLKSVGSLRGTVKNWLGYLQHADQVLDTVFMTTNSLKESGVLEKIVKGRGKNLTTEDLTNILMALMNSPAGSQLLHSAGKGDKEELPASSPTATAPVRATGNVAPAVPASPTPQGSYGQGSPAGQAPYPGQQGPYPGQQAPYPGQQGPYPGQQAPYPGPQGPYPGQQAPYPGQQGPYPPTGSYGNSAPYGAPGTYGGPIQPSAYPPPGPYPQAPGVQPQAVPPGDVPGRVPGVHPPVAERHPRRVGLRHPSQAAKKPLRARGLAGGTRTKVRGG